MKARIHGYVPRSRANGPGVRAALWFQGCTLGCAGCFNPAAQPPYGGEERETTELMADLTAEPGIEGVTFSGGEPFQQPEALLELATRARALGLGVIVFSGYTLGVLQRQPLGPAILAQVDTLIAGPYDAGRGGARGLIASDNQQAHHLSARYAHLDFAALPNREAIIHPDGSVTLSGVAPYTPPR